MTWPSGGIPTIGSGGFATSAQFNAYRDALLTLGGTWSTWTPTWNASTTSPTLGATVVAGHYRLLGKTCDAHLSITIGSGFAAGTGGYNFTLPPGVTPLFTSPSEYLGAGNGRDASGPTSRGFHAYYLSSTAFALFDVSTTTPAGAASPWVWASGDILSIDLRFEVA